VQNGVAQMIIIIKTIFIQLKALIEWHNSKMMIKTPMDCKTIQNQIKLPCSKITAIKIFLSTLQYRKGTMGSKN
jgi:hypothetical protein